MCCALEAEDEAADRSPAIHSNISHRERARLTLSRSSGCVQQAAPHDAIPPKYQRDIRFSVISPVTFNFSRCLSGCTRRALSWPARCALRVWRISLIYRWFRRARDILSAWRSRSGRADKQSSRAANCSRGIWNGLPVRRIHLLLTHTHHNEHKKRNSSI